MKKYDILGTLGANKIKPDNLVNDVLETPELIPELLKGLSSENARVKFGSAKILRLVSTQKPEVLYPHFNFFVNLLDTDNNIIKWNAIDVIANLAPVDSDKKLDKLFKKFYGLMNEGSLITAGHVMAGSATIVKAKPYLEEQITKEILKIDKIPLPTEECRNILKGHAIKAFELYFEYIKNKDSILPFVKSQLKNTRNATKTKAEKFLKKIR